ncbi:hypothetical protein HN51_029760 [Arachis hypogaea]|uniref:Non-structural maintenance of chromosomes element 4 n=2 Tax=Arachis TaxID=3817 RepID=A0A445BDQ1_ARAHY|nr:non-structural maintenance of chromosomes element 4 homolog A [Arachis duranensis]XP_025621055.1 non-structural maintenance of chromosomes element 4 homolog A [Arachis hypogaea]QHO36459.1 uncharacterized protein DS421_9g283970 [Arachis hypogaea]RYR36751.1 hypothetical protein Ahy_A09g041707 [Arachis hypogaea]
MGGKRVANKRQRDAADDQLRTVKRERVAAAEAADEAESPKKQDPASRRFIRSEFFKLKTLINEKKDDLMNTDSDKFDSILNEFHKLHDQVQKPREQVADAEALLELTNSLVMSVRSMVNDNVTPAEFVGCLIKEYGQPSIQDPECNSIDWKKLGLAVSPIFMKVQGCCTMLGPMERELKQRKIGVQRQRTKPTSERARPQEVVQAQEKERSDTDQNMKVMFDILAKMRRVQLECLILNRTSFAQTVENLFSLSFLVKDGRAQITVDENRIHYVSPRNAPSGDSLKAKEATFTHFMFRLDFQDWKLMKDMVPEGKELMPHRTQFCTVVGSQPQMGSDDGSPRPLTVTPIRKFSRNRGLVVQEEGVVEESPECDDEKSSRAAAIRNCKRKLT